MWKQVIMTREGCKNLKIISIQNDSLQKIKGNLKKSNLLNLD